VLLRLEPSQPMIGGEWDVAWMVYEVERRSEQLPFMINL